jgi:hypothetical protein
MPTTPPIAATLALPSSLADASLDLEAEALRHEARLLRLQADILFQQARDLLRQADALAEEGRTLDGEAAARRAPPTAPRPRPGAVPSLRAFPRGNVAAPGDNAGAPRATVSSRV